MTALELRAALVFVAFHLSTLVILASLPASAWQWTLGSFELDYRFVNSRSSNVSKIR